MSHADRFAAYAAAFEQTYEDDDWSRLRAYFTEDAVYETVGDDGARTTFDGIDALLDGLREAVDTFDRRFAVRKLELRGELEERDATVSCDWDAEYTIDGAPALRIGGTEEAFYDGDRIRHLRDTFDSGTTESVGGWMSAHADKLPPAKR